MHPDGERVCKNKKSEIMNKVWKKRLFHKYCITFARLPEHLISTVRDLETVIVIVFIVHKTTGIAIIRIVSTKRLSRDLKSERK